MRDIWKTIRYSSELRLYYIAIAIFVVILALLNLVIPFLTKQLVDLITAQSNGQTVNFQDALLPLSLESHLGHCDVRLLKLEALIDVKEKLGRDKDKAVLAILRHTLTLSRRSRLKTR